MNEVNQNVAENLGLFLSELKEEVVKGLQEYFKLNGLSLETV